MRREDGEALLWVDRHYVHEGSFHAFSRLGGAGRRWPSPASPSASPTTTFRRAARGMHIANPEIARMVRQLEDNTAAHRVTLFGLDDPRQGIVHVVGPEQGLDPAGPADRLRRQPHLDPWRARRLCVRHRRVRGRACADDADDLAEASRSGCGSRSTARPAPGVAAKDIVLAIIAQIGADGATGHAIEYAGSAIRALSIEGRLTLCNMSIEAGARCGMVAPDDDDLRLSQAAAPMRRRARSSTARSRTGRRWRRTRTRSSTARSTLDAAAIAPIVTWGTSPEDALPIDASVPDPAREPDEARADICARRSTTWGSRPAGSSPTSRSIASSSAPAPTARIEDLRAAAAVLAGRTSKVPGLVSPGSSGVKRQAEEEGLDRIFRDAGLEWAESGCSMCVGINGDLVAPGERCASTTNRNFRGRQGPGARTHLMSPAMVAAAAVTGHLADVRPLLAGRKV